MTGLFRNISHVTLFAILAAASFASAQSSNSSYPSPVTTNEITGLIKARDVGDARLTTHFYTFGGNQGDLFVNVVTKNFSGDIDIFTAEGLRPLTKIVLYADISDNETGRVIYLRKPEKIILRIEGRTPNDEPATYRLKFAGGFVAAAESEQPEEAKLPEVVAGNDSPVRVNSVGTIIPTPARREPPKIVSVPEAKPVKADSEEAKKEETDEKEVSSEPAASVIITDNTPPAEPKKTVTATRRRVTRSRRRVPPAVEKPADSEEQPQPIKTRTARAKKGPPKASPDPLENVKLVILFKDGRMIERPMTEVLRFSVDRGQLTVISKNGTISRFSILDVAKVTIE